MSTQESKGYAKFHSPILRWIVRYPLAALAMHWVVQGMLYMDATERWFKLSLDLIVAVVVGFLSSLFLPWPLGVAVGFVVAHTLNFLINGHLWGVLKHYGYVFTSYDTFNAYLITMRCRALRQPSLERFLIYGSLARAEWSSTSDLDVRLVRKPGFTNGIRACSYAVAERARAFFSRFPLDMYVFDSHSRLSSLNPVESPIDFLDQDRPYLEMEKIIES